MVRCVCRKTRSDTPAQLWLYIDQSRWVCVLCGCDINPGGGDSRAPAELVAAYRVGGMAGLSAMLESVYPQHGPVRDRVWARLTMRREGRHG